MYVSSFLSLYSSIDIAIIEHVMYECQGRGETKGEGEYTQLLLYTNIIATKNTCYD